MGSSVRSSQAASAIDLFENVSVELDTECFLLLGLLYCKDRQRRKAQIFYSIIRGASLNNSA